MRRLLSFLAVAAIVLAACTAGGDAVIANVDGTDITLDEVRALRPDSDSVEVDQFTSDLQLMIINLIVRAGAAELGVEATEQELADELATITAQIEAPNPQTGESITFAEFMEQQNLSDAIVDLAIEQQVLNQELTAYFADTIEVTDEQIQEQYNIELQSRSQVCSAHILLEDEETANEVLLLAQEEGADFSALAMEYSTGPSAPNGGVLGCTTANTYVPAFAIATLEAPLNEPFGPVQSEFGFHILLVTSREVPELEDIRGELADSVKAVAAGTAVNEWFLENVNTAAVTIEPEYGAWEQGESGNFTVVAPTGHE